MVADIITLVVFLLLLLYGYKKGIVTSLINLVFIVVYFLFSEQVFNSIVSLFKNNDMVNNIVDNIFYKYLVIAVIGIILLSLINLIIRSFLDITKLSVIDKLFGLIIYGAIAYTIVCIISIIVVGSSNFIDFQWAKDSYLYSDQFNSYNIIRMWFGG
ncbi:CvpA family protein [Mycoplasma sp. P36-A1]|uniref:CvpA family protein n=1 Tax=Mycoplasma sp. P36-A1 TaxID=3252900 RepID=UPI003C2CCDFA